MTIAPAVAIGDLVRIIGGGTPTRSNDAYYGDDIPWVTPKDMKSWEISSAQVKITQAGLDNSAARLAPANSVLVVVRSGVLKHTVPVALNRRPVAINQDMKALICSDRVDPDYLAHFIKERSPQILKWVRATTADNFPIEGLKQLEIPLPSVADQRRIAEVLDRVDTLRAKRREAITLLGDVAQSIFLDTFGDPVVNPRGWIVDTLGNLSRIVRGASPRPKGDPRYFGGDIPWLMISDVTRSDGRIVSQIREGVTEAGRDRSVYLKAGTLILTNSATVGVPKFLGVAACIHDGFLAFLDISERIHPLYLYYLFALNRERISAMAPEGTQKNLNTGIAKSLQIPIPPLDVQLEFCKAVEANESLVSRQQAQLVQLDALFASLQHRAFRGELFAEVTLAS